MKNQLYTGTPTSRRQIVMPSAANIVGGEPLFVGTMPCVALDSYETNVDGATALFNGTFLLTVVGTSQHSPIVGEALNPGDPVYASGTKDATTNVTYGLLLSGTTGDTLFGHIDPTGPGVGSGDTAVVGVVINAI